MKVILYCSKDDSIESFRDYFNLDKINFRIWSHYKGINVANKIVYVISDKFKADIDRILMLKTQDLPDNNIFIL